MAALRTITRDRDGDGGDELRPRPCLFQILDGDRPLAASVRYLLGDVREVRLGRGEPAAAHRTVEDGGLILTVRLPDTRMSSRHARLVRDPGGFAVIDDASKNGTFVGGARLTGRRALRDGDLLECGHTFFLYRDAVMARDDDAPILGGADAVVRDTGLATLDPTLARAFAALADVARSAEPVMVLGESGTGKEIVARAVHAASGRSGPLVAVNCAALPATLVEAELFGHRRGAFSGAIADRPGLVRSADGGTLFLDEIGDLPAAAQAALLRVLQEREVLAVGATEPVAVDFRLVVATHRDLAAMVAAGRFREDLFARVAAFTVRLPPLRERRHDLGLIIAALLRRLRGDDRAALITFDFEAVRALLSYAWPRNVRELEKCLGAAQALALSSDGPVRLRHLAEEVQGAPDAAPTAEATPPPSSGADQALRDELVALLGELRGNISEEARRMGKTRTQIHRWAQRFGIDLTSFR
jgi:DNA-binding NtrC family response regulator